MKVTLKLLLTGHHHFRLRLLHFRDPSLDHDQREAFRHIQGPHLP